MSDNPNTQSDAAPEAPKSIRSMDELAAIMAANREQMRGAKADAQQPNEGVSDDNTPVFKSRRQAAAAEPQASDDADDDVGQPDDDTDDTTPAQKHADADADDESGAAADDAAAAEHDSGDDDDALAAQDGQHEDDWSISDDDLIEIEGLDEPVSFKDLKDVYQADKTVSKNVEDSRVQLEEATNAYRTATEQAATLNTAMQALVSGIEQVMAQPLVSKPDAAMKSTNPAQYIQHMEAYEQDQQRIQQSRNSVLEALDAHRKEAENLFNQRKQHEIAVLADKLPALKDPQKRQAASKDILDAAAHFGFSPEEINKTADHRLFLMAHMAQQYLKLTSQSKQQKEETETRVRRHITTQPRVLRSKNTKPRLAASQKEAKRIKNVAQKSGKPDDVAAFMAANRRS